MLNSISSMLEVVTCRLVWTCTTVQLISNNHITIQIQIGTSASCVFHKSRWIKSLVFRNCFAIAARLWNAAYLLSNCFGTIQIPRCSTVSMDLSWSWLGFRGVQCSPHFFKASSCVQPMNQQSLSTNGKLLLSSSNFSLHFSGLSM